MSTSLPSLVPRIATANQLSLVSKFSTGYFVMAVRLRGCVAGETEPGPGPEECFPV